MTYITTVHDLVRQIPRGRVTTYGAIAEYLHFRSPRMVGWALRHADLFGSAHLPAHRVVNRKGILTGKLQFPTPTMMEELLTQEGVHIENDTVQDFEAVFITPAAFAK